MSENRQNRHTVSIPADWSLPKFALAQRVQTSNPLSDTPYLQTGKILGIQYLNTPDEWVTHYAQRKGWHYAIHLDGDDPLYRFNPVISARRIKHQRTDKSPCSPVGV